MTVEEAYKVIGDYNDAKNRFSKEESIVRFAVKFKNDKCYERLKKAVSENNIEETFNAAHTLKGVAGNLSFTKLQKAASDLTEQTRTLKETANPELVDALDKSYTEVISIINEL